METYCRYHPVDHAGWHCLGCQRHFCQTCVPVEGLVTASCPVCQSVLRYTGAASEVTPFWQRLSDFFSYPFAKAPMVLIAICTLLPAIAGEGVIGFIVGLFLLCAQTKYVYSVIEATASGEMSPPGLGTAFGGGGLILVIQQVVILLVIMGILFLVSMWAGHGGAIVAMFLIGITLPASIMILATEHQISQALDPSRLYGFISALGWPYFVMYGYLMLLILGMGAVQAFVLGNFSPAFALTVTGFVASYFFLVIFHMMGYVLFQYQYRLGGALVPETDFGSGEHKNHGDKQTHAEIDIALKDGNYDLAIEALVNLFNRKSHDKVTLDRLFRLLLETKKWDHLDKKSRPVLALLLEGGRIKEIRQMLRGLYKQRPDFEVRDKELSFHLAQSLYHAGEYRLLLRILKDFGNRFKGANEEPDVLELSARALANGLHNGEKAKLYLQYLAKQFPSHSLAEKVPGVLQHLEKHGRIPEPAAKFG